MRNLGLSAVQQAQAGEFNDSSHEARRLLAELFGTFLLVLSAAGGDVINAASTGEVGRVASVVAPGLSVMVLILILGSNSGAHVNPAITLAFALRGDFQWRRVPGYILAQLLGASLAAAVLRVTFGLVGDVGATHPGAAFSQEQAVVIELLLTLGLVSTVLGAASGAQNIGSLSAVAVGGYIALAGLWAGPVSGASMNIARSFGPDLVRGDFGTLWIYLVGPLAGMLIAVGVARALFGSGGGKSEKKSAQGSPKTGG